MISTTIKPIRRGDLAHLLAGKHWITYRIDNFKRADGVQWVELVRQGERRDLHGYRSVTSAYFMEIFAKDASG